jgi:hypothetical protein
MTAAQRLLQRDFVTEYCGIGRSSAPEQLRKDRIFFRIS